MWPRRKRWDLMSSSFNPSITRDASGEIPRIHPGAWARSIHHGQMMGPNYGTSGNAAINAAMGGGILDKFKDKKRWKHMAEALDKMKNAPIKPLAAGRNVGDSGIQYTPTDMGAYVGDPVARQRAMAEARRKKEKEGLMNLLGGGY